MNTSTVQRSSAPAVAPAHAERAVRRTRAALARTRSALAGAPPGGAMRVAFWPALAIVPATVGALAGALARGRPRGAALLGGVIAAAGVGVLRWQLARLFVEAPNYEVEQELEGIEVRRYPKTISVRTRVSGRAWRVALDDGFRRLAGYLFGDNAGQERIAMTAPVTTHRDGRSAFGGAVRAHEDGDGLVVSFFLPAARDLASLPEPLDGRVQLVASPPRRIAVLRYRGSLRVELARDKQRELFRAARRAGLRPIGEPGFAGYDPPSTLPFLRRNEVWIEIA